MKVSIKKRRKSLLKKATQADGELKSETAISGPVLPMSEAKLEVPIVNLERHFLGTIQLDNEVFGQEIRKDLIHRVVVWQRAAERQGTHQTKSRGEVSGSGKKPHPQKGTGKARAGSRRAPHHRGGGRAHPVRPKDFSFSLNKKIVLKGLKVALSAKLKEGNLAILDKTQLNTHKTKALRETLLQGWNMETGLIIHANEELDPNFALAARNIEGLNFCTQAGANVWDILRHRTLIITVQGLHDLQARLTTPKFVPQFPGQDLRFPEGYTTRLGSLNANGLSALQTMANANPETLTAPLSDVVQQAFQAQTELANQHRALATETAIIRGRRKKSKSSSQKKSKSDIIDPIKPTPTATSRSTVV
jgi:large subunit ribosomal protein L4